MYRSPNEPSGQALALPAPGVIVRLPDAALASAVVYVPVTVLQSARALNVPSCANSSVYFDRWSAGISPWKAGFFSLIEASCQL